MLAVRQKLLGKSKDLLDDRILACLDLNWCPTRMRATVVLGQCFSRLCNGWAKNTRVVDV